MARRLLHTACLTHCFRSRRLSVQHTLSYTQCVFFSMRNAIYEGRRLRNATISHEKVFAQIVQTTSASQLLKFANIGNQSRKGIGRHFGVWNKAAIFGTKLLFFRQRKARERPQNAVIAKQSFPDCVEGTFE